MESSHDSPEQRPDPTLSKLLEDFGSVLIIKGRLVEPENLEDGRKFVMEDTELLSRFNVKSVAFCPRYFLNGEEFPESLFVETEEEGIEKMIYIGRRNATGQIETNVWMDAPLDEEPEVDVDRLAYGGLTAEEIDRVLMNLEFEMSQTIDVEDVLMLRQLAAELRRLLD